jgi:aminoglycoside phosphotransferase (APT) family kinase protein
VPAPEPDRVADAPPPGLDLATLTPWLEQRVPGLSGPLTAQRLTGGQSNPSWLLRAGNGAWVLRAKPGPAGSLLPSAHAIEREYAVLAALRDTDVPVPDVEVLCEDESIIGAAFYVMSFADGRIFRDAWVPEVSVAERTAIFDEANRVIAALHSVDWRAVGLSAYGRHDGFFERLISRWTRQYRASETQRIEAMERLIEWLPENIPAAGANDIALVHGDYRLENLVFHPTEPRVIAILDWELSTLGSPLSDFAYHCAAWHTPSGIVRGFAEQDLGALGIPTETAYLRRYCERTGRDDLDQVLADWHFYLACNFFRLAAILQGIAKRVLDGIAASPIAVETGRMAGPTAEIGWELAHSTRT